VASYAGVLQGSQGLSGAWTVVSGPVHTPAVQPPSNPCNRLTPPALQPVQGIYQMLWMFLCLYYLPTGPKVSTSSPTELRSSQPQGNLCILLALCLPAAPAARHMPADPSPALWLFVAPLGTVLRSLTALCSA
jgi:hypothetical protein